MNVDIEKIRCYPQVVKIIFDKTYDPNAVILKLACDYPDIFMECIKGSPNSVLTQWQEVALPHLKNKNLILAIKEVRELTGWGLKETKDAVENFLDSNLKLFV